MHNTCTQTFKESHLLCVYTSSQWCSHTPADGDRWNNYTQTERWDAGLGFLVLALLWLVLF